MARANRIPQLCLNLHLLRVRTVDFEPRRVQLFPWLDPQHEFGIHEFLSALIQQHRIDAVAIGIAHACGHEHVFPAVCIEVARARSPRPIGFQTQPVGDLFEFPISEVVVKGVPENKLVLLSLKI